MRTFFVVLVLSVALVGCKTSQVQTATSTEGVVISSVDTAMHVWHDWVVAGKATQAQVDTVRKAYDTYYNAQQFAKAAIELSVNTTNVVDIAGVDASVTGAEQALMNLITQYTRK